MKAIYNDLHHQLGLLLLILTVSFSVSVPKTSSTDTVKIQETRGTSEIYRRILHQPLFPASSAPPPGTDSTSSSSQSPPPPPDSPVFPSPDQPFFPEVPAGSNSDQSQQPPAAATQTANGSIPIPAATQPAKPAKKVAIAISVGIVTLGMLSALAFFLYRHRAKHPRETQKLVGGHINDSQRLQEDSRMPPPSSFLYIGTVEPSRTSVSEANNGGTGIGANGSPYHKLNSVMRSDRYRPSPELQPLPPLAKPPPTGNSPSAMSSSDEDSHDAAFYTPQGSSISNEESYYTPVSRSVNYSTIMNATANSVPHSKRTSPKSRLSSSSPEMKPVIVPSNKQPPTPPPLPPEMKHVIVPSNKQPPTPPPLPPELLVPPRQQHRVQESHQQAIAYSPKRPKFSSPPPPPPPNMALLRSINNNTSQGTRITAPPPPPPPPPPTAALSTPRKVTMSNDKLRKQQSRTPSPKDSSSGARATKPLEEVNRGASSSEKTEGDDPDGAKPKLKPLHWDKVRATSERATVWDQLKSSSFQLNEGMMETLFGCNSTNSVPKESTRRSVLPLVEQENRVLDPKKSQNIAILLRALNVTRDEVSEALLDGNPDSLGAELLETLVKMAPTKEEEIKLRECTGDISKLGSAERFLKTVLDIPFAFKRVEAMLYRANFDTEVKYLRKSFQTLEEASEELKKSRLFLKLIEAVLRTGNRMNVGTNRGDAKAFKLDTLLKLVDIKGTDGKTTLLHFVVQEIIRSEGAGTNSTNENLQNKTQSSVREDDFRKQGLQVVAGLSRDLSNVKKAAGMDSDVLSSYVSKLEMGLEKVRFVLQYDKPDMQGKFFNSMKTFLKEAEEEIAKIKADERKALSLVKEVTEYFHGDTAKEEAHPFRIFMIVRDFLSILDHVCKEVGNMHDRTVLGSARSFRISATASLPVLNRYNVRQDSSSDEDSSSP